MALDVDAVLAKATDNLTAGRSFGPVVEHDGCTVIPAAIVMGAGGGGGGEGPSDSGQGSGAGYFTLSYPIGAYVVRDGQVRFVPAFDATRVAIAALALLKLTRRRRRRDRSA